MSNIMNTVTVDKLALKKEIEKNLEDYENKLREQKNMYRNSVIQELEDMLTDIQIGLEIRKFLPKPEPSDHSDDYKCALKVLELSTDETISISYSDFRKLVMNDWNY